MTGAMYAGIAGLKTHMQNLNVIGNNIANINTDGYKAGRSVFQTALYTQIRGGSDGSSTVGARNPAQLGYGVAMGTVDIDMSTGSYKPTGKTTDCMIDGDGFFLMGNKDTANLIDPSDPSTFTSLTLSRVGDISFKSDGYLANHNGDVVYGFLCIGMDAENQPVFSDQLVPIRYPRMESALTDDKNNTVKEGDGTGGKEKGHYYIVDPTTGELGDEVDAEKVSKVQKVYYPTAYEVTDGNNGTRPSLGPEYENENVKENVQAVRLHDYDEKMPMAEFDTISFDENTGLITGTTKDTDQRVVIGMFAIGNVTNPDGVTQVTATQYKAGPGAGDLTIATLGNAGADVGIEFVNGSLFKAPADTPDATPGEAARIKSAGTTALITGGLEMSKTDLATEIANMITTQRGYQANTRIITVTDSMLEELVNMKR